MNILQLQRGLRVFENIVLRKIFGSKKDEVAGKRRRLHKEEYYYPYSSSKIPLI